MSEETIYLYDKVDKLEDEIERLKRIQAVAFKILEEWTQTCAQICDNSYDLTVRAKELRFPTPCAGCGTKEDEGPEYRRQKSRIVRIAEPPIVDPDEMVDPDVGDAALEMAPMRSEQRRIRRKGVAKWQPPKRSTVQVKVLRTRVGMPTMGVDLDAEMLPDDFPDIPTHLQADEPPAYKEEEK